MSLYGALFGGVSGLNGQGAKIAIVSDNIANVNTVGYKQSEALFETLVVNSTSTVSYQTGGVRAESRMNVDEQGLLLSTSTPTDIAISGQGFFTVNANIDGSGQPLYTRAGSFRQDSLGNFVNAAGFYLQGWPLDREGRLPGEPGNLNTTSFANLDSLETVNVESASGIAQATTVVELGANLNAGEDVFPGQGLTTTMDNNNAVNFNINANTIIAPSEEFGKGAGNGLAPANDIVRGDRFEVITGNGLQYEYEYGGFTVGRDITDASPATNFGDAGIDSSRLLTQAGGTLADTQIISQTNAGANPNDVAINFAGAHGLIDGDQITLTGTGAFGAAAPNIDGTYNVTVTSATQVTITLGAAHGVADGANSGGTAVIAGSTLNFSPFDNGGVVFDANSANEAFFGATGVTRFTQAALSFTISTSTDTHTFTYTASSPNVLAGQFNNLTTLAEAIDEVAGLTARVASDSNNGNSGSRLLISAEDANEALTFANGEWPVATFTAPATTTGIDWISELDLSNVAAGARRWNTLSGLERLVDADEGVTGVVENALSNASLQIRVDDPLDTIRFRDMQDENTFNIPLQAAGDSQFEITAAAAAGVDIPMRLTFATFNPSNDVAVGDQIVITNEAQIAALAAGGLPFPFPSTPGAAHAQGLHMTVTAVTATTIEFTVPGAFNTAGVPAAVGVQDASGLGVLSVLGESNQGSLVAELFAQTTDSAADPNIASLAGNPFANQNPAGGGNPDVTGQGPQDTGLLGPRYDSSGTVGQNMASGNITAQFSRNVRIFDALGAGHDIRYSFIKIDENEWAVEVHAIPATDVTSALPNGQIAVGTIQFNGDGTLRSISSGLTGEIQVTWTNGAVPSNITIDWGTAGQPFGTQDATAIGDTDGLSQFDSDYNVRFANQNGAPVGELVSVIIDEDGFVIASYNNGETQNLYRLPIAEFTNPNGLRAITGNVFAETRDSGTVNLREAGTNGVGDVVGASLEQSNVELSEELTDLIVAQRAYQSNTRVISASDELLEQLNNI